MLKQNTQWQPIINIITIVYNDVENIEKTLKSVLNQSYENIHYIVIDGGSSDGTRQLIEKYQDKLFAFLSEKDTGISDAFNKGTRLAEGDYINYMNSGDVFINNQSVSIFADAIVESKADVITAFSKFVDKRIPKKIVSDATFIGERSMISHQASFISKALFDKYGLYDEDFRIRMDYEFWLRVLPHSSLFFINDTLVDYADGGISGQNSGKNFKEEIKAQIKNLPSITLVICLVKSSLKYFIKRLIGK
ncbi:hypothetical protein B6N13_02320 [Marinomonas sp. UCMA 3892]|uniref:glycosyltransferase family 2 protein n=1 Tax=Marinomonas sp. UCMA 3892 TaxID=1972585 RepID=UPI00146EEDC7|nr:glycosyltransferase family 2 protein [Marinomonas sp. UCMA 3892]NLU96929.1 hypothetical protein [Marinomonas sp. UCMA 3892]